MKLILQQLLDSVDAEVDVEIGDDQDEVSFMYYSEHCNCKVNAKCKSSKCICFLRSDKCTEKCHDQMQNKCANK